MSKLNLGLIAVGLTLAWGAIQVAGAEEIMPTESSKPAPRSATLPPAATRQGVTFAQDIKPLFEASCVRCHSGPRAKARLNLESLEGVLKGSEDHKVIVPGRSENSPLVLSVARVNPKTAMPPEPRQGRGRPGRGGPGGEGQAGGNNPPGRNNAAHEGSPERPGGAEGQGLRPQGPPPKPLTPEQVGLVRAWIDQGAK